MLFFTLSDLLPHITTLFRFEASGLRVLAASQSANRPVLLCLAIALSLASIRIFVSSDSQLA